MNKKTIFLFFLLIAAVFLSACQADPRKAAQAYATRSEADQKAADAELARQYQEQLRQEQLKKLQLEQAVKEANKPNLIKIRAMFIWTFGIFGCICLAAIMLYSARSYSILSTGVAHAAVRAATVRANRIRLDRVTRQYDAVLCQLEDGKWAALNLNDGSVRMLHVEHAPDRQLIAAMGATQIAGVLAREAATSKDPGGMAMINPPVVHAQSPGLAIGTDYADIPWPVESEKPQIGGGA